MKKKKRNNWPLIVTILAFTISLLFSFMSESVMPKVGIIVGIMILILFIFIGIIFNLFGLRNWFMISDFITVLTSVGIFSLLLNIHLKENDIYIKLRNISMTIYFMHMWVYSLYCMFVYKKCYLIWIVLLLRL